MPYSPRPRRFRRIANAYAAKTGLATAAAVMAINGLGEQASRYAAQITRAAKRLGTVVTGVVWTKHGGRARRTAAYDLGASALALIAAVATYLPGGKRKADKIRNAGVWRRALAAADLAASLGRLGAAALPR
jgi:alpha-beta hydrolase superfamily lysophospholipase